jgi:hypothetical protein
MPIATTTTFSPSEVAFINARGAATVAGQAFLRQAGGGVVTCAGTEVELLPAGDFAKERITLGYGNVNGGRLGSLVGLSQEGVDPRYLSMVRTATCDADGNFEFKNVADGEYYVLSRVTWIVPGSMFPEGGNMAKLIQVRNGQSVRVIVS